MCQGGDGGGAGVKCSSNDFSRSHEFFPVEPYVILRCFLRVYNDAINVWRGVFDVSDLRSMAAVVRDSCCALTPCCCYCCCCCWLDCIRSNAQQLEMWFLLIYKGHIAIHIHIARWSRMRIQIRIQLQLHIRVCFLIWIHTHKRHLRATFASSLHTRASAPALAFTFTFVFTFAFAFVVPFIYYSCCCSLTTPNAHCR